jgi:hypothetical protein
MSKDNDGFVSVSESGVIWEPKQTGNKKAGNLTPLTPNDKSWLIGYYMETETGIGAKGNSSVHKLIFERAGDMNHFQTDEKPSKGDSVSIWGAAALDGKMAKVSQGKLVKITWLGKKMGKQGGNEYHDFDVAVNHNVEPMSVGISAPQNQSPVTAAQTADAIGAEDDLPFN